jgi:small subunit ribosomal protein S16
LVRPDRCPTRIDRAPAPNRKEHSSTVAVKIKLARFGKIREPHYRIVVADARTRRSGRTIENIGLYQPKAEPSVIEIDSERVQYWLGVGAQPTEPVLGLLKVTGDWQKFKGLPGAEGTLRPQPVKADKRALYEAAIAAVGADEGSAATTPRRRPARPAAEEPTAAPTSENTDAS